MITQELEKLIEETLFLSRYNYLRFEENFLYYIETINEIYPIRSHQIIAKCAIDYLISQGEMI